MVRKFAPTTLVLLWTLILHPPSPALGQEGPESAFWAEFNYTILSKEKFDWLVSPSYRSDEQEVNGRNMSRLTTDGIVRLSKDWEVRGRFFLIGRQKDLGGAAFDQRVQIRARHPIGRTKRGDISFLGGMVYERHFRGDVVPDFNVYRPRVDWEGRPLKWNLGPWGQQDLSFDHGRGFFRNRTRIGLFRDLRKHSRVALAYQFQYTQNAVGRWMPQHAIFLRYWFGGRLSARRGAQ